MDPSDSVQIRIEESRKPSARSTSARGPSARSHGSRRRRRLAARNSLSFERATLSRDVARIRRILAACRTTSGNVVRTRRVLTARGKSSISCNDERRLAEPSFEPRASVALFPVVSSRGTAARAGRGTRGPSRSSARSRGSAARGHHREQCDRGAWFERRLREPSFVITRELRSLERQRVPGSEATESPRAVRAGLWPASRSRERRGLSGFLNPLSEHYPAPSPQPLPAPTDNSGV